MHVEIGFYNLVQIRFCLVWNYMS